MRVFVAGTGSNTAEGPESSGMTADAVAAEQFRSGQQLYSLSKGGRLDAGASTQCAHLVWALEVHS